MKIILLNIEMIKLIKSIFLKKKRYGREQERILQEYHCYNTNYFIFTLILKLETSMTMSVQ
jgi:hypothetical protein